MADRRTITMNWDGLAAVDDDDCFFESLDRISSAAPFDLAFSSGSDDDDDDVSRVSFASAISSAKSVISRRSNYDVWKEEPGSIAERRRRLLQGMGLSGDKELIRLASAGFTARAVSKKAPPARGAAAIDWQQLEPPRRSMLKPKPKRIVLVRSRSDGDIGVFSPETERLQNFFGPISKQRLTRTRSTTTPPHSCARQCRLSVNSTRIAPRERERNSGGGAALSSSSPPPSSLLSNRNQQFGAYFLIKNLDTGNEFIVKEFDQHGMWNRLRDLHTGKQLTMEEFEKSMGYYSPAVMDLMRRQTRTMPNAIVEGGRSSSSIGGSERKVTATNSSLSRSFRNSMRRGTALLKNIKGVANSVSEQASEMLERKSSRRHFNSMDHLPALESKPSSKHSNNSSSTWTKVRQLGKSHKELTALHMCQEIQAHEGSIWSIQFSSDARYLASAGEDRVIHVWEVQECEIMSTRLTDDWGCSAHSSPIHPAFAVGSPDRHTMSITEAASLLADKKKKGKSSSWRKGNPIPDYVHVPETVFALSEKPTCTFQGHQDDILDLSWSKSQLLLSSSMDKTVRLWDMETKSCLKLFAHNDYVTCIQFNPIDDDYFISGSLDAKVRMWNVPNRQVTDWADLHDMVTAASYTPDGQAALIGSHKGHCRMYNTTGCNLRQINQFDIQTKKKSHAKKKITGFQFPPGGKSSEVLISSADSRIRIYDSSVLVHKFRGFRNSSSQISASFTPSGKHVICASEDSHVYVWKRDEVVGKGKGGFINTRSHENFHCRDVSVAVPWPGTVKGEPPPVVVHSNSKRHSKRSTASAAPPCRPENNKKAHHQSYHHHHHHHHLPPLAGKSHTASEEDLAQQAARIDSGIGFNFESFRSSSGSARYSDSPLIPASERFNSSSSSWLDGGRGDHGSQVATAWGMVIVTAGLGGEIRAYQNFGLPVRVGRQPNLF